MAAITGELERKSDHGKGKDIAKKDINWKKSENSATHSALCAFLDDCHLVIIQMAS